MREAKVLNKYNLTLKTARNVNCWGGMGKYEFCDFYNYKEIENERDLQTQEKLLEVLNMLIDEGVLKISTNKP